MNRCRVSWVSLVDERTRTAGERILAVIQELSQVDLVNHKMTAGKISDYEIFQLRQRLLLSKFMGVF